jgi:predicted Kef-type K+ transport protein
MEEARRANIMLMDLDLLNFIFMMIAAIGPLYMACRLRARSRRLFALAVLLAAFTITHGAYHLLEFVGFGFIAEVLFWPLSTVLLLCFGILYWRTGV